MHIDQQVIALATGIQRRHDFTAHTTGFAASAVVVGSLTLAGVRGGRLYAATLLTWATVPPTTDGLLLCQRAHAREQISLICTAANACQLPRQTRIRRVRARSPHDHR